MAKDKSNRQANGVKPVVGSNENVNAGPVNGTHGGAAVNGNGVNGVFGR
jgi:hypothetical protein